MCTKYTSSPRDWGFLLQQQFTIIITGTERTDQRLHPEHLGHDTQLLEFHIFSSQLCWIGRIFSSPAPWPLLQVLLSWGDWVLISQKPCLKFDFHALLQKASQYVLTHLLLMNQNIVSLLIYHTLFVDTFNVLSQGYSKNLAHQQVAHGAKKHIFRHKSRRFSSLKTSNLQCHSIQATYQLNPAALQ